MMSLKLPHWKLNLLIASQKYYIFYNVLVFAWSFTIYLKANDTHIQEVETRQIVCELMNMIQVYSVKNHIIGDLQSYLSS